MSGVRTKERLAAGIFYNGFRSKEWFYKINENLIGIRWAHYKDKYLGFETNVFAEKDTVFYGENMSELRFSL